MKSGFILALLGTAVLSGCASHRYTSEKFAATDGKIAQMDVRDSNLEASVNRVDEAHKRDVTRIDEAHKREVARIDDTHKREIARIDEAHRKDVAKLNDDIKETMRIAKGKFVFTAGSKQSVVLFDKGSAKISDADQQALSDFAKALIAENKNVFLEIKGHTDTQGTSKQNEALAVNRAEAVRQILHRSGVALNRMAVIGLPESKQGGQQSAEERAQSRRVTISVVE
ncbi:MAG: OmpA family protein [Burkholderiaceae bacterium]|nr:OmpA family protein [Burkholderiaceae bacterium]